MPGELALHDQRARRRGFGYGAQSRETGAVSYRGGNYQKPGLFVGVEGGGQIAVAGDNRPVGRVQVATAEPHSYDGALDRYRTAG